jgi:hypothetical protein
VNHTFDALPCGLRSTSSRTQQGSSAVMSDASTDNASRQRDSQTVMPVSSPLASPCGSRRSRIKGQDFEVALLLPDVDDEIQGAGKIAPDRFEIARVPVAFGLRGEMPCKQLALDSTPSRSTSSFRSTVLGGWA